MRISWLSFKLGPLVPGLSSDSSQKSHDLVGSGAVRRRTVGFAQTFFFFKGQHVFVNVSFCGRLR